MSEQNTNPTTQTPAAAAPQPGTPEYDAAMIAKADQAANDAAAASRPDWLPEKFTSAEDLAAAYAELEKKLGGAQKTDDQATNETPSDTPPANPDDAAKAVEAAGLDMAKLQEEFDTAGTISEASYEALAKAGITKEIVDGYIAGQQALAVQMRTELLADIGGQEAYDTIHAWADANLPDAEKIAMNTVLETGDMGAIKLALNGLKARYEAVNGKTPKLLGGQAAGSPSAGFESEAQMIAAMKDPRYQTDPAYRRSVERRVAAATY